MQTGSETVIDLDFEGFQGQADVSISNLTLKKLDINLTGVSTITGKGSSVEQFSFNGNGIVNADFTLMPADNAYLNFSGFYMIMLKMNGGNLAGRLNGQGKMIVEGNIMNNSIIVDNPDFITYK